MSVSWFVWFHCTALPCQALMPECENSRSHEEASQGGIPEKMPTMIIIIMIMTVRIHIIITIIFWRSIPRWDPREDACHDDDHRDHDRHDPHHNYHLSKKHPKVVFQRRCLPCPSWSWLSMASSLWWRFWYFFWNFIITIILIVVAGDQFQIFALSKNRRRAAKQFNHHDHHDHHLDPDQLQILFINKKSSKSRQWSCQQSEGSPGT